MMRMPEPIEHGEKLPHVIPTVYKYILFRSRLEAKWAVFFDRVGISWTYEPEGYSLGVRTGYIPDFRIDDELHAEIKRADPPSGSWNKAYAFSMYSPIACLAGTPMPKVYPVEYRGARSGMYFTTNGIQYTDECIDKEIEVEHEVEDAIYAANSYRFEERR